MIRGIIFDFDGTLINTNDVIIEAWQHTYKHYGMEEQPVEHITKCFGEPLLITMEREFPDIAPEESAAIYRKRQVEMADKLVRLFDDIPKMLKALKEKGYKIGIVTSRTGESTRGYLDKFKIGQFFDQIVSCDDTDKHKPNPEPVLLGLKKLCLEPDEAIMVGDSFFDMKCANNADVATVLVNWRATTDDENLGKCKVDYTINKPMELIKILEEM